MYRNAWPLLAMATYRKLLQASAKKSAEPAALVAAK
jgi:hypothetical protein